jgi:hypothetical protein
MTFTVVGIMKYAVEVQIEADTEEEARDEFMFRTTLEDIEDYTLEDSVITEIFVGD